jgi:hypothetical protein
LRRTSKPPFLFRLVSSPQRFHHANLEAEIAQRATQLVLDVEGLGAGPVARHWQAMAGSGGGRADSTKELSSFDAVIVEMQRSIPWRTRIRTKSNRAKRSLGRSITTRATCPAKRSAKMNPNSPTLTGNKVVTINKMKSAEFARADPGAFLSGNRFVLCALLPRGEERRRGDGQR